MASFKAAHAAQCVAFVAVCGPNMISAGRDGNLCRYQCRQQGPSAEQARGSACITCTDRLHLASQSLQGALWVVNTYFELLLDGFCGA